MADDAKPAGLTIGAFGNTYWAGRLAESLIGAPVTVRHLYVDREDELKARSFRQWLAEKDPWQCDVLHVLGWPTLWSLWLAARNPPAPRQSRPPAPAVHGKSNFLSVNPKRPAESGDESGDTIQIIYALPLPARRGAVG